MQVSQHIASDETLDWSDVPIDRYAGCTLADKAGCINCAIASARE